MAQLQLTPQYEIHRLAEYPFAAVQLLNKTWSAMPWDSLARQFLVDATLHIQGQQPVVPSVTAKLWESL